MDMALSLCPISVLVLVAFGKFSKCYTLAIISTVVFNRKELYMM